MSKCCCWYHPLPGYILASFSFLADLCPNAVAGIRHYQGIYWHPSVFWLIYVQMLLLVSDITRVYTGILQFSGWFMSKCCCWYHTLPGYILASFSFLADLCPNAVAGIRHNQAIYWHPSVFWLIYVQMLLLVSSITRVYTGILQFSGWFMSKCCCWYHPLPGYILASFSFLADLCPNAVAGIRHNQAIDWRPSAFWLMPADIYG